MGVSQLLDSAEREASLSISRLRRERNFADTAALSNHHQLLHRDFIARSRASDYVWLSAILERFITQSIAALTAEIHAASATCASVRPSLLALSNEFESLKTVRDYEKTWTNRLFLMSRGLSTDPFSLTTRSIPFDGGTIRPIHLEIIWKVFGLPGESIDSPRLKFILKDVADNRNLVAHGETDSLSFGKGKPHVDVLAAIDAIETLVIHIFLAMDGYLRTRSYIRSQP